MAIRWRADDGPLIVVFESSFSHRLKKKVFRVRLPLAKISGSAHAYAQKPPLNNHACTKPRSAVGSESDCRSRDREFDSGPLPYFFEEIDHEIISMVMLLLPPI